MEIDNDRDFVMFMLFIGVLISFAPTFEDYMHDGKIFNVDVAVWNYDSNSLMRLKENEK